MKRTYSRYLVTGSRLYRGHPPGSVFEAALDPPVEQRAIERGAIRVLARITPILDVEGYQLPEDWPPPEVSTPAHQRRREAPLSSEKEGNQ